MRKQSLKSFFDYIEQVAANHKTIKHSPTNRSYKRVIMDDKFVDPFGRVNFEEFKKSIKTDLALPCLIAVSYQANGIDPGGDSRKISKTPMLIILDKAKNKSDMDSIVETIDKCTELMMDVIGFIDEDWKIAYDNGSTRNKLHVNFDELTISHIPPGMDNLCGVKCEFTFINEAQADFDYNPDKFLRPLWQ